MHQDFLLVIVVVVALAFDFTNGFHDTANAVAPTIASGALRPRVAVGLSSVLNMVGAFLSLKVAATIASALVAQNLVTLPMIFAGLAGAICWNVLTWYLAIPSSSSHALIGGVIGAMLVLAGGHAVLWGDLITKVIVPGGLSPVVALVAAAIAITLSRRLTKNVDADTARWGFRAGQIGSASLLSLAHGTNDAQKTMGVVTLALIANGTLPENASVPTWVIWLCAAAIAAGTFIGGWRIIRTMGKGFTHLSSQQSFSSQIAAASVIFASSHAGLPLSTTHVATGSIVGVGAATPSRPVRWRLVIDVVIAWLVTLPAAGLFGALEYFGARSMGATTGVIVMALVTSAFVGTFFYLARRDVINAENVNDEWGQHPESIEMQTAGIAA